jgi:hypothetical protein
MKNSLTPETAKVGQAVYFSSDSSCYGVITKIHPSEVSHRWEASVDWIEGAGKYEGVRDSVNLGYLRDLKAHLLEKEYQLAVLKTRLTRCETIHS